ncbi:M14 family zinc carboxypeptidase, partial [Klebsiella aerogenes]|uniref:M14 family zinc carboxypeptidase n=1 Tax=Klebsiella aerogenes TaxID=548 RepID=UPI001CC14FAE
MPSPVNGTASTNASPKLFFECSIHAREWISAPTCAWQLKQLLEGYANNDADARFILNTFT